jgi:hypothetical protein
MPKFGCWVASAALVVSMAFAAGAEDAPKPSDSAPPTSVKVEVARGDRWTYEIHDDITDELRSIADFAVTDATNTEIDTRVRFTNATTNAESTSVQVFDANWRLKDNGVLIYRPALDDTGIPADIQIGKTWTYNYEMSRINPPSHFKFIGKAKVEAWERVALLNGLSYEAFKIDFNETVTPVVNNRKWETHVVLWYAPAANRYVKRVYELRQNGKLSESMVETLRNYSRRDQ